METQRLNGELALVTGSDSGIGQVSAIAFAREGADVIVTWLHDRAGAEHTAKEVEATGRKAAVFHRARRGIPRVRTGALHPWHDYCRGRGAHAFSGARCLIHHVA